MAKKAELKLVPPDGNSTDDQSAAEAFAQALAQIPGCTGSGIDDRGEWFDVWAECLEDCDFNKIAASAKAKFFERRLFHQATGPIRIYFSKVTSN